MGLDMYLKASKYLSGGWSHSNKTDKQLFNSVCRAAGITKDCLCEDSGGMEIQWTVAYWRKANAIHKWFVDNVQAGSDQCQTSYVGREELQNLVDLCNKALATKDTSLLPPQSGFFFGSTAVDDWYWQDIEETAKKIGDILTNSKLEDCEFYYRASW